MKLITITILNEVAKDEPGGTGSSQGISTVMKLTRKIIFKIAKIKRIEKNTIHSAKETTDFFSKDVISILSHLQRLIIRR